MRVLTAALLSHALLATTDAAPIVRAYATVAKAAGTTATAAPAPKVTVHSGAPSGSSGAAAWAAYTASYDAVGWDVLNVTTSDDKTVAVIDSMYAAGYLEGYLTQKAMYVSYQNIYSQFFTVHMPPPAKFVTWIDTHMAWVRGKVSAESATDSYWEAVGAVLAQLDGLTAGYNSVAPKAEQLTAMDMLLQNMDGDLESLHGAVMGGITPTQEMMRSLGMGHPNQTEVGYKCSALVRAVPSAEQNAADAEVSFQWKNPDFLLKNPDFLFRNPDFLMKSVDFIIKTALFRRPLLRPRHLGHVSDFLPFPLHFTPLVLCFAPFYSNFTPFYSTVYSAFTPFCSIFPSFVSYSSMVRMYKHYNFHLGEAHVSFTSNRCFLNRKS